MLFRHKELNVAELEMRNDSTIHYKQIRFNMNIQPGIELLLDKIPETKKLKDTTNVIIHGGAIKRFGRW